MSAPSAAPADTSFQFHKVRLKVSPLLSCLDGLLFQFHKVRLKVMQCMRRHQVSFPFQFHKVRLKESLTRYAEFATMVSIP